MCCLLSYKVFVMEMEEICIGKGWRYASGQAP